VPERFEARPLRYLDALYKMVGGLSGPNTFAVESAIQPVHDVSRIAQIGSGFSDQLGYFVAGVTDVHSGAGAIRASLDPYDQVDARGFPRADSGVWLISAFGTCSSSANFVTAGVAITYPTIPDAFAGQQILTHIFPDALLAVTTTPVLIGDLARVTEHNPVSPLFIPDGSTLDFLTQAVTGANTINLHALMWAGARGALPPGLA